MPGTDAFLRKTPRELGLLLRAFAAREKKRQTEAWLLGRYMAFAVHDLAHYPPPPFAPSPAMTDEEMKQRLLAMRGKETHNDP